MKKTVLILSFIFLETLLFCAENNTDWTKDILAYAHIRNPEQTLAQIESYFAPKEQAIQSFISMILLKNTQLNSMDLSKELIYIRSDPHTCPNPFLYAVYLKDRALFLTGFGKELFGGKGFTLKEETKNSPIMEFIDEKTQFDREGYLKALEKEPADPRQFQKKITISYFVAFIDTRVIVSGDKELINKFIKTLPPPPSDEKPGLALTLKPALIYKAYQKEIHAGREKLKPILSYPAAFSLMEILEKHLSGIHKMELSFGLKTKDVYLNIRTTDYPKGLQLFPLILKTLHQTGGLRSFYLLPQPLMIVFNYSPTQKIIICGYGFFHSLNIRISNLTPTPVAPLEK